ncbi:MAG TPA: flagellar assembly protein FliW [Gemmatirosa sp.]|nr:flagellar assembly protein FliW [Gemmatirosa sp.]
MPLTLDAPPSAEIPAGTPTLTVASDLLGAIELPVAALYTFAAGLYAFDRCRRFALVPAGREGLFWLQSVEERGLVFLLADPFHWFPDYVADVPEAELAALGRAGDAPIGVLAIVTLPGAPGEEASVNLRAPVILDPEGRSGRQVVLRDDRLGVREPLALAA